MDVNGSLSVRLHLVEAWTWSSDMLWWFVLVVAVSTLIALIHGILAVYRLHPSRQFLYIMAVIGSDSIMLITICFSLIAGKYKPTLLGPIMCKSTVFVSNTAAFFSNWTWVLMWTERYLDVVHPMRRFYHPNAIARTFRMLCFLLICAIMLEFYSLVFVTENTVDGINGICDLDLKNVNYDTFKWVTLCDSIVSFIIPLVLTAIADIGVFSRRSTSLMSVARERLGSRHDMHSQARSNSELSGLSQSQTSLAFDCAKIQSEQRIQRSIRRRQLAIVRCVLIASVDLTLNLPSYILQMIDNFINMRLSTSIDVSTFYIYADAIAYILYFLQFPFIAFYVHVLAGNSSQFRTIRSPRTNGADRQIVVLVSPDDVASNKSCSKTNLDSPNDLSNELMSQTRSKSDVGCAGSEDLHLKPNMTPKTRMTHSSSRISFNTRVSSL